MQSRLLNDGPQKTYALILSTGEDVLPSITKFAKDHGLAGSELTAIGAFERVVLGYFDWERKDYKRIPVEEQVEVVSIVVTESPAHLVRRHDKETGLALIRF